MAEEKYQSIHTGEKIDEAVTKVLNGEVGSKDAVLYTPQTLTEEQKAQARENIGAAAIDDTDIPKVFIDGVIPTTKDDVLAEMQYISRDKNFHAYIKIKCQGSSSMSYPKKNFTVKLYSDEARGTELPMVFKDWGIKVNKFVLKANYIDHSHARNIVSARLWDEVVASRPDYSTLPSELRNSPRNGAVDGFPIKVYTNGTYQGIYTWNIGKDAWMWGMDEDNANHVLLCGELNDDGTLTEKATSFRALWSGADGDNWSIEVGTNSTAVKNSLNALISCVMDTTDEEFKAQVGTHLDIQSALDYYLFSYVTCGLDSLAKNMLLATYDGTKWICGQYDMDSTFGLYWNGSSFVSATYACPEEYQEAHSLLWERIEALYIDELLARYAELRASVLSFSNMVTHFERFMDAIGSDLYAEDLTIYTDIPSGDTNNIKQIRDFIRDRLAYVDQAIVPADAEYEELAYIEASGTQYIDTGISGGSVAGYEIKLNTLGSNAVNYEQYLNGNKSTVAPGLLYMNGVGVQSQAGHYGDFNLTLWPITDTNDHVVAYNVGGDYKFTCDGEELETATRDDGWGSLSWYVCNSAAEPTLMSSMRLYYLKMWKDGELVRDFIPVRRTADSVVCLFDKVSGTYFENAGAGEFIAGE